MRPLLFVIVLFLACLALSGGEPLLFEAEWRQAFHSLRRFPRSETDTYTELLRQDFDAIRGQVANTNQTERHYFVNMPPIAMTDGTITSVSVVTMQYKASSPVLAAPTSVHLAFVAVETAQSNDDAAVASTHSLFIFDAISGMQIFKKVLNARCTFSKAVALPATRNNDEGGWDKIALVVNTIDERNLRQEELWILTMAGITTSTSPLLVLVEHIFALNCSEFSRRHPRRDGTTHSTPGVVSTTALDISTSNQQLLVAHAWSSGEICISLVQLPHSRVESPELSPEYAHIEPAVEGPTTKEKVVAMVQTIVMETLGFRRRYLSKESFTTSMALTTSPSLLALSFRSPARELQHAWPTQMHLLFATEDGYGDVHVKEILRHAKGLPETYTMMYTCTEAVAPFNTTFSTAIEFSPFESPRLVWADVLSMDYWSELVSAYTNGLLAPSVNKIEETGVVDIPSDTFFCSNKDMQLHVGTNEHLLSLSLDSQLSQSVFHATTSSGAVVSHYATGQSKAHRCRAKQRVSNADDWNGAVIHGNRTMAWGAALETTHGYILMVSSPTSSPSVTLSLFNSTDRLRAGLEGMLQFELDAPVAFTGTATVPGNHNLPLQLAVSSKRHSPSVVVLSVGSWIQLFVCALPFQGDIELSSRRVQSSYSPASAVDGTESVFILVYYAMVSFFGKLLSSRLVIISASTYLLYTIRTGKGTWMDNAWVQWCCGRKEKIEITDEQLAWLDRRVQAMQRRREQKLRVRGQMRDGKMLDEGEEQDDDDDDDDDNTDQSDDKESEDGDESVGADLTASGKDNDKSSDETKGIGQRRYAQYAKLSETDRSLRDIVSALKGSRKRRTGAPTGGSEASSSSTASRAEALTKSMAAETKRMKKDVLSMQKYFRNEVYGNVTVKRYEEGDDDDDDWENEEGGGTHLPMRENLMYGAIAEGNLDDEEEDDHDLDDDYNEGDKEEDEDEDVDEDEDNDDDDSLYFETIDDKDADEGKRRGGELEASDSITKRKGARAKKIC